MRSSEQREPDSDGGLLVRFILAEIGSLIIGTALALIPVSPESSLNIPAYLFEDPGFIHRMLVYYFIANLMIIPGVVATAIRNSHDNTIR